MNAEHQRTSVVGGTLKLAAFAALAALIVAASWRVTHRAIDENQRQARMALFRPVLGNIVFDTLDYDAPHRIPTPHSLPGNNNAEIYHAYRQGQLIARIFSVEARGYSGPIALLIGIDTAGTVTGVRVLNHTETPGLGDEIERDKSSWIETFVGRSVGGQPADSWQLKRDGGEFDGFTGASVTPRAVIRAVHETLQYAQRHPPGEASTP